MIINGAKKDISNKQRVTFIKVTNSNSLSEDYYSYEEEPVESVKQSLHITHSAMPDKKQATFSTPVKNPYWPDKLWRDDNLIYSYKNPENCLHPPTYRDDKIIRFNSRFESGNLMYAYRMEPDVYHCILEYDHSHAKQCQWFYFQMSNIKINPNSSRKMTFYISGFNKPSGVFSSGSKIFMYSEKLAREKNIGWFRTGSNYSYGVATKKSATIDNTHEKENNKKKKGKNKHGKFKRSTLQFQITFPYDNDVVYLCYAQPYTFTDLNSYISKWIQSSPTLITRTTLCKTNGYKDCPLLTITSPNSAGPKKCIFLTARIHPGESNGSIVLHGLIDFLLSKKPLTDYLLTHFIFKIVPMINIDGVVEGFYRVGLEGEDLNRVWNNPDPTKHPVVFHTKNLMHEMHKRVGVAAYIDFHGHSREHGTFAYGCPWNESENLPSSMMNKEKIFPKILASLCESFSFEKCVFSIPPKRKDASRCVIRRELGVVNSFTIESSFGGYSDGFLSKNLYHDNSWKEIGQNVGQALYHLFAEPTTQVLKNAEKEVEAYCASRSKQEAALKATINAEKALQSIKQNSSLNPIEANSIVAIDTENGYKVIGTNYTTPTQKTYGFKAPSKPESSVVSEKPKPKPKPKENAKKDESNTLLEAIYMLKMSDLSSSSSSSSRGKPDMSKYSPISKRTNPPSNANASRVANDNKPLNSNSANSRSTTSTPSSNRSSNSAKNDNVVKIYVSNLKAKSNQDQVSSSNSVVTKISISSTTSTSNASKASNSGSASSTSKVPPANSGRVSSASTSSNQNRVQIAGTNQTTNTVKLPSSDSNSSFNRNANKAQNTSTNPSKIPNSSSDSSFNRAPSTSTNTNTNKVQIANTSTNTNSPKIPNSSSNSSFNRATSANTNKVQIADVNANASKIPNSSSNSSFNRAPSAGRVQIASASSGSSKSQLPSTSGDARPKSAPPKDAGLYPSPRSHIYAPPAEKPRPVNSSFGPRSPRKLEPIPEPLSDDYEESSTRSYLSTQSDSNSFCFLDGGESSNSNSSLLSCSTATFNSSSTYGKPPKSIKKLKPKIQTPIQNKQKSQKSPKVKASKM